MGFIDDILGKTAANAARDAAADTYGKQNTAITGMQQFGNQYATDFRNLADSQAGAWSPYAGAGSSAITQLMAGLGLGGDGAAFTSAYRSMPGYQAGQDAGLDAVMRRRAAMGMLGSGNTQQDLYKFASDYEDQRSGDYLSRLMGLAGMGQNAVGSQTGQYINTVGQGMQGNLAANNTAFNGQMQAAGTIGQGNVSAANAESSALNNLMQMGGSLLGSAMGGGFGFGGGGGMSGIQGLLGMSQSGPTYANGSQGRMGGVPFNIYR